MELAVLNTLGQETGRKVVLSDAVFGVEANDHAIYLDVKQFLADQRQGTHKAKQRNEVAGSTRKLKRQKGTGGARCEKSDFTYHSESEIRRSRRLSYHHIADRF